jgi:hypothetical protein
LSGVGTTAAAGCIRAQLNMPPHHTPPSSPPQADIEKERQEQLKGEHARRTELQELTQIYRAVRRPRAAERLQPVWVVTAAARVGW